MVHRTIYILIHADISPPFPPPCPALTTSSLFPPQALLSGGERGHDSRSPPYGDGYEDRARQFRTPLLPNHRQEDKDCSSRGEQRGSWRDKRRRPLSAPGPSSLLNKTCIAHAYRHKHDSPSINTYTHTPPYICTCRRFRMSCHSRPFSRSLSPPLPPCTHIHTCTHFIHLPFPSS